MLINITIVYLPYVIQVGPFFLNTQTLRKSNSNTFSQKWNIFISIFGTKECVNILCFFFVMDIWYIVQELYYTWDVCENK